MALIKSISGIRGTIGGRPGDSLSPVDIVHFTAAYGSLLKKKMNKTRYVVVIGRDARISGEMVSQLVAATLTAMGIDVINLELATTPTVEIAVTHLKADGGIIITASHNPGNWNALKLLNADGEFISAEDGVEMLNVISKGDHHFETAERIGRIAAYREADQMHIKKILNVELVDVERIRNAGLKVAVDGVNSVGGLIIPRLLRALGVDEVIELYCEPTGIFPHNPEPLPENLNEIASAVVRHGAHVGFTVDPDVDRLAIINEDGSFFGEEYTLVAVADYVLQRTPGNTVSNLSSSRALKDVTLKYGGTYSAAAVGEVNVVQEMKRVHAVIGGEGNGGVIFPGLHYGRDALAGIALFLSHLAGSGLKCSDLRRRYPDYYISKNKLELSGNADIGSILQHIKNKYKNAELNDSDGIRIDFDSEWVHLRQSNTEPIMRIISESRTMERARKLALQIIDDVNKLTG
ncbi:MAG: phosphoglucosamine mutase [Bacteroidales bacterium]|nr:phosphoglucosamine mutase [Bacteroidales bacterium]